MAMPNKEHVREFAGMPVRRYNPRRGIVRPEESCQRIGREFHFGEPEGELSFDELIDGFLAKPACARVAGLVIGPWWDDSYSGECPSSAGVVARLIAARDRLLSLRAIFLGDITYEENEITWIRQCDVTPLLEAFPKLEHLKVRGAGIVETQRRRRGGGAAESNNRLRLSPVQHAHLKSLVFEAGCLPSDVTRAVAASRLPALEHLELWLGDAWSSDCGDSGDTTVEDLAPILKGKAFPSLRSLAIRNSRITDPITQTLANSPILGRLDALDLSLGTLGNAGALALIRSGAISGLKRLDIHHHYVSEEVLDGLKELPLELDASDRKEADEAYGDEDEDDEDSHEDRYIALGE